MPVNEKQGCRRTTLFLTFMQSSLIVAASDDEKIDIQSKEIRLTGN